MIQVDEDQLDQVEYLIDQSIQGNHVLFEPRDVTRILTRTKKDISDDEAYAVEHHIENIILQPTLVQKRAYIERLDAETYDLVVRTYFNIVENNIFENNDTRH